MSYDEPKILSSQLNQFCLMGADVGHVKPYAYEDAATLLADFWQAVDAVLKERGAL